MKIIEKGSIGFDLFYGDEKCLLLCLNQSMSLKKLEANICVTICTLQLEFCFTNYYFPSQNMKEILYIEGFRKPYLSAVFNCLQCNLWTTLYFFIERHI